MKPTRICLSIVLALCLLVPHLPLTASAASVDIASTFPDANFRTYVSENFDNNGDGSLSDDEIQQVTQISCVGNGIASVQGIAVFSALEKLEIGFNQLTSLNLSQNTSLSYLDCWYNNLSSLDLSNNPNLTYVDCQTNQIRNLNISACSELTVLHCTANDLTTLDVRNNKKLQKLYCDSNTLSTLDVSANPDLEVLYCQNNHLTDLDLSKNEWLKAIECYGNGIKKLNIAHQPKLVDLVTSQEPQEDPYVGFLYYSNHNDLYLAVDKSTELILEAQDLLPPTYTDDTGVYAIENGEATFQRPSRTNVSSVKVPDTVTIGTLTVPVTKIGPSAFRAHQKKLTKVTIGKNVKEIGKNAFFKCTKLKTVSGGANLEIIGGSAFQNCTKLTKFTIGAKVKEIGKKAFFKCSALKTITFKSRLLIAKTVGANAFKGIKANATIKVPKAVKKEYTKWLLKKGVKKTMKIK